MPHVAVGRRGDKIFIDERLYRSRILYFITGMPECVFEHCVSGPNRFLALSPVNGCPTIIGGAWRVQPGEPAVAEAVRAKLNPRERDDQAANYDESAASDRPEGGNGSEEHEI